MTMKHQRKNHEFGCACDCGVDRREFLAATGMAAGGIAFTSLTSSAAEATTLPSGDKQEAVVRAVFLYPPSETFSANPDGWWSWPGNDFDAEGRQKKYAGALRDMEKRLGMKIAADNKPVTSKEDAQRLIDEIKENQPDGLLLMMFYNRSLPVADQLLQAAEELGIPIVFFIGLGVKHGQVRQYRREGVYFIQSLDNLDAIEYGMRMITTKKRLSQSLLLSITEAKEPREGVESFLGIKVRVIPFSRYAEEFKNASINDEARELIASTSKDAKEIRGVTQEAFENAARAHLALKKMLADEGADGVTMNCLKRGMLKPCISFATLNNSLIPAACENDLPAAYTQLLGQLLTGRPGFQHNPCFETERNHYYGSHCTCATKLYGPEGEQVPYLLRRFAHTNEGSCAIQVFWNPGDPVTMVRYYPGQDAALDVYSGKVFKSHPMPPAAGCTTNVEIEITDRPDACQVSGHHNLMFCGDFARKFRLFAQLYKIRLADTGYEGPWPV
ncbi:MAG: twin-arginine translocation signal domain-containing protein [Pirellulaceae bacterium]|nr:twin-arginine translocation signal domain-containing protein [Pirellulaceae bacterium]